MYKFLHERDIAMKDRFVWLRIVIAALLVIPLLMVVLAFVPALLFWPMLKEDRRAWLLQVFDYFIKWVVALVGGNKEK
ncbi:hypothetical protein [Microbispora triticiradicis]|uniref:Uncharacterized protein n=2 Tax=Microbispora TaxID=2005 RepID=A0ABY3M4L3_9ACTN|nr:MULTISPECIES: hypothetical protein [Microbispora]TLP57009.1 hypothetical protein FED44_21575 [Microbispora fusca]TYB66965.1 hypothetical protein FXF59_04015 [Microbispora tritici]